MSHPGIVRFFMTIFRSLTSGLGGTFRLLCAILVLNNVEPVNTARNKKHIRPTKVTKHTDFLHYVLGSHSNFPHIYSSTHPNNSHTVVSHYIYSYCLIHTWILYCFLFSIFSKLSDPNHIFFFLCLISLIHVPSIIN